MNAFQTHDETNKLLKETQQQVSELQVGLIAYLFCLLCVHELFKVAIAEKTKHLTTANLSVCQVLLPFTTLNLTVFLAPTSRSTEGRVAEELR